MSQHNHLSETSPPLPDSIVQASRWANTYYPQTITGLGICIGNVVTDAIIRNETDHETLARSVVTPQQTAELVDMAHKMHAAYKIDCRQRGPDEKPEIGKHTFSAEGLASITTGSIASVQAATAHYARAVLPVESTLNVTSGEPKVESEIVAELFSRSPLQHKLRPEAIVLGVMWKAGARYLAGPEALAISKDYRDGLRVLSASDITKETWFSVASRVNRAGRQLRIALRENVAQDVSNSGGRRFQPDKAIINSFIANTTSDILIR